MATLGLLAFCMVSFSITHVIMVSKYMSDLRGFQLKMEKISNTNFTKDYISREKIEDIINKTIDRCIKEIK